MLGLTKIEIIEDSKITGTKNALQFIHRDAAAMFLDYNEDCTGSYYLVRTSTMGYIAVELDTYGIDWRKVSDHRIKA